jgi:RND family efflux transporter MFP subunit
MDLESFKAQKEQSKLALRKDLEVAEAAVKAAEWNLAQQTLRSPVAGVVLDRPVPLGTRLGVNDHVMQIADVRPQKLVMRAQVDEEDITRVRVDPANPQKVRMTLYAFPGRSFEGKVVKIYDKADPSRRTFEVDVMPNEPDPKFAAGMTGELAFEVVSKAVALVVPSQAVQDGRIYLVQNGRLKGVAADVGVKGIEKTEVLSGVKAGERVLVTPVAGLRDGQWVRDRYMDPNNAAALNRPKAKEVFRGGF